MYLFYLIGLLVCWFTLGVISAGFYIGFCQRSNHKLMSIGEVIAIFGFIILGGFSLCLVISMLKPTSEDWIKLPKYKSKGQLFLEKLES